MKQPQKDFSYDEGIDLFALILVLWREKRLILFTVFLCTVVGIICLWLAKPVYEAKAYIYPPSVGDIAAFNYGKSVKKNAFLKVFTVKDVYGIFTHNLSSQSMKQVFFKEVFLPTLLEKPNNKSSYDTTSAKLDSQLIIKKVSNSMLTGYIITVKNQSATLAVEWANKYISIVNERTISDIQKIIQMQNSNIVNGLKLQIDIARKAAQNYRQDQLIRLKEDLNIASAIGLKDTLFSHKRDYLLNQNSIPNYFYGTTVLQKQIDNLSHRKSDDPFSSELRHAQEELSFYKNMNIDTTNVAVFQLDGGIISSKSPVSPKKGVIIIVSMMLGFLLGAFIVIIRNYFLTFNLALNRRE